MRYDIVILGSGPAGLSAAVAARGRNKSVLVVGNRWQDSPLARAECVDNYLGLPSMTGAELMERFTRHAEESGASLVTGKVISLMAWEGFHLTVGSEIYEGGALILAPGVVRQAKYPGEMEYLGRGVSYCATCDGFLYKGKTIAVLLFDKAFEHEAEYLATLAQKVYLMPMYKNCEVQAKNVEIMLKMPREIAGGMKAEKLIFSDGELAVDGIFILRSSISPATLLRGLKTEGGHIAVDRQCRTNLAGVFAAGDCTGRPYQYVKAAGEGNVAAHAAVDYLAENK